MKVGTSVSIKDLIRNGWTRQDSNSSCEIYRKDRKIIWVHFTTNKIVYLQEEPDENFCPICENEYGAKHTPRERTYHHIFPKYFFKGSRLLVPVCRKCHDQFNVMFKYEYNKKWTKAQCIQNWIAFCLFKNKNATKIYPSLINYLQ